MRKEHDFPKNDFCLHQVFLGSPGTGKTSVARIMAQIYRDFGFLAKGTLVEVDRSGLVGAYVGETAKMTAAVIDSAVGGVLFIERGIQPRRGRGE